MATWALVNDRSLLLSRLARARAETDRLFSLIRTGAIYHRPIAERHRIIFYVGHLEAFDWNLFSGPLKIAPFRPDFDRLFAFGIDPVGGGLPSDQPQDWPELNDVLDYRKRVRESLDPLFRSGTLPETGEGSVSQLFNVAIEHRLMHAETLAYMFHRLPLDQKCGPMVRRVLDAGPITPGMVTVPTGSVRLGLAPGDGQFGWDNEFEAVTVEVPAFRIDRYKVTNGEFLEFIDAGAYDNRALWTQADWEWRCEQAVSHPAFWIQRGSDWMYRSMFDDIPLPADWPVYVSHAEAKAYARWKGKRLPSEAEWQRAALGVPLGDVQEPADDVWDPAPVNLSATASSDFGVEDQFGNGWEWTSTEFGPLPGFRPFACYPGYSSNFFDGKHFVLKGGSVRTAACMLRPSFRNWFQSHYQYVYAGFRCADN